MYKLEIIDFQEWNALNTVILRTGCPLYNLLQYVMHLDSSDYCVIQWLSALYALSTVAISNCW